MAADAPAVQAGMNAGKKYAELTQAQGPSHQWGPPHLHIGLAFLEVLIAQDLPPTSVDTAPLQTSLEAVVV